MMFPILQTTPAPRSGIRGFYGINRKKKGSAGECVDCLNVDGDEFPCLRSVKNNKSVLTSENTITKLLAPEEGENINLKGIVGGELVGFGEFNVLGETWDTRATDLLKCSDSVVTFPNMWVYNLASREVTKSVDGKYTQSETEYYHVRKSEDSYLFGISKATEVVNETVNERISYLKVNGFVWSADEDKDGYFVIAKKKTCSVRNYNAYEVEYLCLVVYYYKKDENGVYQKSSIANLDNLALPANQTFEGTETKYTIKTENEDYDAACVWQNRVWACSADGREIRCSKLGELNNFSDYVDGAASAWYCEVGSDGKFTGITAFNDAIFAFKENTVHIVYGTIPQNYSLEKTFDGCGCIDGRSIAVVNNALYWLGYNGVYRYVGNSPKIISEPLGKKYKEAISFSDNKKLYMNLTDYDGNSELLSFDTEKGMWHKHDYQNFIGGFKFDGKLYAYTDSEVFEVSGGDFGEWSFESVVEYNDTFDNHSATEFFIRAEMKKGSTLKVEYKGISESDWETVGSYSADRHEMIKEKFTPRLRNDAAYQFRISGNGEVYVYELEKTTPTGGRKHGY